MKAGDLLEITLRIVQESLKDNENTEVLSNCKIANQSGREREFDIAIKTVVNGFEILVVIECKDYKNAVPVEKIEAFHSKCLRIPKINKKIFVSRTGFQADAVNAANEFGIDCYDIENVNPDIVKSWYAVALIKPVSTYIQILQSRIWTKPPLTDKKINLETTIYHENENAGSTIQEFFIGLIRQSGKYTNKFTNKMYFTKEGEVIDRAERYSFEIENIEGLYLFDSKNVRHDVFKLIFVFEFVEKEVKATVNVERIKSDNKDMSIVVTHETDGDESIKLVLRDGDPNTFDPFIINNKTGEIIDSGYTFALRKKEEKE